MNTTIHDRTRPTRPPLGFLLRKLDRLIDERFERTLGAQGITRRRWQLLRTLAEGRASLDVLNRAVAPFLDDAAGETAEQHLAPLVPRGILDPDADGYALTDAGHELLERLADEVQVTRNRSVAGLEEGEYDRTVATLATMIDNLEQTSESG